MAAAASKTPGILKKMLKIQQDLVVTKTGYDDRNDFWYWKADDVAAAVRKVMNDVGVIHRAEVLEANDTSHIDKNGRERRRLTTTSRIIFIDPEDGSEFPHDVVATGSDVGGDKDARKVAIQAFKIAAVDLFIVAEGMEKLDSDGDPEAEPIDMTEKPVESKAAEQKRNVRELDQIVASTIKDAANPLDGPTLAAAAVILAKRAGVSEESTVWRKESAVMQPLVDAIELASAAEGDKVAAFKAAVTGEVA
ncbi:hypothetical protein ISF9_114 [Microbacterium phage vB_MoxS-ISF9]|uniref:Uncharacterized protein n=1 Tax=Microbacterium phage vB_MoxS-ISF9 TaxID=1458670 RepID=W8NP31_9CAUD|nr:hypothetical protein ISF9_114 [Microbacterium phage vB_MoxS-ISF9]AHL18584.1 hypothetical protein ISF9_114 [Microbacterium phage vB_MoxS-ISF9]